MRFNQTSNFAANLLEIEGEPIAFQRHEPIKSEDGEMSLDKSTELSDHTGVSERKLSAADVGTYSRSGIATLSSFSEHHDSAKDHLPGLSIVGAAETKSANQSHEAASAEAASASSKESGKNAGSKENTPEEITAKDGSSFSKFGDKWYRLKGGEVEEPSSVDKNDGGDVVVKGKDGSVAEVHNRDGSHLEKDANGEWSEYTKDGARTDRKIKSVETNKNGDVTVTDEDGKKEVRRHDGTVFKYDEENKLTEVHFKDGSGAVQKDGKWKYESEGGLASEWEVKDVNVLANGDVVISGNGKSKVINRPDGSAFHYNIDGKLQAVKDKDGNEYLKNEFGIWTDVNGKQVSVKELPNGGAEVVDALGNKRAVGESD